MSLSQHMCSWRNKKNLSPVKTFFQPESASAVAQLDARQTGDQEVAGLTPSRLTTFFHGDLLSFSLPLIQEEQFSFSGGRMCTILVSRRVLSLPSKSVVRQTDSSRHDPFD